MSFQTESLNCINRVACVSQVFGHLRKHIGVVLYSIDKLRGSVCKTDCRWGSIRCVDILTVHQCMFGVDASLCSRCSSKASDLQTQGG